MGMLAFLLILVLLVALVVFYKQKLAVGKQNYQEAFKALKIALTCRHQAVRYVLEASQLYLLNAPGLHEKLVGACDEADRILLLAGRRASKESLASLCKAETKLNCLLRELQKHLEAELKHREDHKLSGQLEMLDAAENDVIYSRRAYNRSAERYNQLFHKVPISKCAHLLGHREKAGLVKFEDNAAAHISKHFMV